MHNYTATTFYESKGDGTHTVQVISVCKCGDTLIVKNTEKCTMKDGECIMCGYKKTSEDESEEVGNLGVSPDGADFGGKITIGDYSSKKLAKTDETVYVTREVQQIKISSSAPITLYATSEDVYYTISDIEGAATDDKIKWKTYYDSSRPTIPTNKAVYVYAKLMSEDGSATDYYSTGKVIHDTTPPTVDSVSLGKREGDQILPVTGKDPLSGIERFFVKYEAKPKDDSSKAVSTPTAQEVIDENRSTEPEVTEQGVSAGAFTYSTADLLSDVSYVFWVVARDYAGNISAVKSYETKGKGPDSTAVSGNGLSNDSAGSSALTPAPNGIAGSGNGAAASAQPASSAGNGAASQAKASTANNTSAQNSTSNSTAQATGTERKIDRTPYIYEATGDTHIGKTATGGWDKINKEIKAAEAGSSVSVEMSGLSVVPASFFEALRAKDVTATVKTPGEILWVINGLDIKEVSGDIDLGVVKDNSTIPADILSGITDSYPHTELSVKHSGDFGFTTELRVPFDVTNADKFAIMYYYDTESGELELVTTSRIGPDGYAGFKIDHASEYSIVVRAEDLIKTAAGTAGAATGAASTATASATEGTGTEVTTQSQSNTVVGGIYNAEGLEDYNNSGSISRISNLTLQDIPGGLSSTARVRIWLFAIAFVSAVLCVIIIFAPSLQTNREENREEIL